VRLTNVFLCTDEATVRHQADSKRFMRFGRKSEQPLHHHHQQQQQALDDADVGRIVDAREPSTSAKRFMRFGRQFMRFGRARSRECELGEADCK